MVARIPYLRSTAGIPKTKYLLFLSFTPKIVAVKTNITIRLKHNRVSHPPMYPADDGLSKAFPGFVAHGSKVPNLWVILLEPSFIGMAYPRFRRRRPLRYRRRRRRFIRRYRRRTPIMRRRAGAYSMQKLVLSQNTAISVGTNRTKSGTVAWHLSEFYSTSPMYDYYKIIWASWMLKPATSPSQWTSRGIGTIVIDYDDTQVTEQPTSLGFTSNSTRRWWSLSRGVYRKIRPKAVLGQYGGQGQYIPPASGTWLNSLDNGHKHLGFKYSIMAHAQNVSFPFFEVKQIWVLWRNQL